MKTLLKVKKLNCFLSLIFFVGIYANECRSEIAEMINHKNGATITKKNVLFFWSDAKADKYYVWVGSSRGAKDILNKNRRKQRFVRIAQLPNTKKIYFRLWTKKGGDWNYNDYSYDVVSLIKHVDFISQLDASCSPNYLCGFASSAMLVSFFKNEPPSVEMMQRMAKFVTNQKCPTKLTNIYDYDEAIYSEIEQTRMHISPTFDDIKEQIDMNNPVLTILPNYGAMGNKRCDENWTAGHSVVTVGYSSSKQIWIIHDPLCSDGYKEIPSKLFRNAARCGGEHDVQNFLTVE